MKFLTLLFNLIFAVVGWVSSAIALWNIYCTEAVTTGFIIFCLVISIISIFYVVIQIHTYIRDKRRVFIHSSDKKVHAYLFDWIKSGGRTVIFTRDFTWADCSHEMLDMLKNKARRRELIVCLYKSTEITDDLQKLGAEVYIHNLSNLKARFTIINYGTNYPQVTVGSKLANGYFVNERYDMHSYPNVYNTFVELFESAKAFSTSIASK